MCLFPNRATKQEFGKPKLDPEGDIFLPCGKCYECKSLRASDWAIRCSHEISMHDENCFITLTYDNENIENIDPLSFHDEFEKFMKKLRKDVKTKLSYIVSHEYGGKSGRPHHHAIIFGYNPDDQVYFQDAPSGEPLFRSDHLESKWTKGFSSIGTANEKTAYYIASYSLKSNSIDVVSDDTGEINTAKDKMGASKNPAIGYNYFIRNAKTFIYQNNRTPRYYVKLLQEADERLSKKEERFKNLLENNPHNYSKIEEYEKDLIAFREFALQAEELLEIYENNQSLLQNTRSPFNKLSKLVSTEQKESNEANGLRTAPKSRDFEGYKHQLKYDHEMSRKGRQHD